MVAGICNNSITLLSPYKYACISYIPTPQLKHQYIDYTNGSSIVSGQKIHVDFDYGNGLDCRWLWKAVFCIEACLSNPIHKMYGKKSPFEIGTFTFTTFIDQESTSDEGDEVQYQGFCLIFDID